MIAARAQTLRGAVAPAAAAAHRNDCSVTRYLTEAVSKLAKRDVLSALDVAGVPLVLFAHVEEVQIGTPLAEVLWQHEPILAHGGTGGHQATRERLLRERADLASTVARIRERLAVPQRDSGGDVALANRHPADVAGLTEARELDVTRQVMSEARTRSIDEAPSRADRGEYGRCVDCGTPIPEERLELVPERPYWVEHAERERQGSAR